MQLFAAIVIVAATIAVLWWLFEAPPPGADTVITIRSGQVRVKRGHVRPAVLANARALLEEAQVKKGYVAIADRRLSFSRSLPKHLHQRLRNVILNP
jgi:hypothetical protein